MPVDRNERRAIWRDILLSDQALMLVAVREQQCVGHLAVTIHSQYGAVLGMMIEPGQRGHGIGRRLLKKALAWAQARGLPALSLLVFAHNAPAIALYRSCDFRELEYYKDDVIRKDGQRWDTILMRRVLQAGQELLGEPPDAPRSGHAARQTICVDDRAADDDAVDKP